MPCYEVTVGYLVPQRTTVQTDDVVGITDACGLALRDAKVPEDAECFIEKIVEFDADGMATERDCYVPAQFSEGWADKAMLDHLIGERDRLLALLRLVTKAARGSPVMMREHGKIMAEAEMLIAEIDKQHAPQAAVAMGGGS